MYRACFPQNRNIVIVAMECLATKSQQRNNASGEPIFHLCLSIYYSWTSYGTALLAFKFGP